MNTLHDHHDTPASRNEAWGFWGTMREHAALAWPMAITSIAEATGESPEAVRAFLDSWHGRHFADDVNNGLHAGQSLIDAVQSATARWMTWTITRSVSREYGIPRGMPYLQGLVVHHDIFEEASAD
jgi:hypothetical protein